MTDKVWDVEAVDAQDNVLVAAVYRDIGVGPAVVFDGGAFTDPDKLRDYLDELGVMLDWLTDNKVLASGQEQP